MPSGAVGLLSDTAAGAAAGSVVPGIGTIIGGTVGLAQGIIGMANEAKAKKEAEQQALNRPKYPISPLAGQQLSLTESDLSNGMSAGAENAYNNLNNQQYSASIGSIIKSGGNVNSIGSLYGDSQDGRLKIAMMKDNLRLNQINNYVKANQAYQDQEQNKWQIDQFAPWEDKTQAIANARQGASQQTSQGVNTFASSLMNGAQSMSEAKQFANPVIVNPNNPNANANGTFKTDTIPNYVPKNYNFSSANTLSPMAMPTYNS